MKTKRVALNLAVALVFLLPGLSQAAERVKRMKDTEVAHPGNGVLLFSQIKTHKRDLLWGFEVGRLGEEYRYLAGREVRFPSGFYDIGCGRVGSVTAISLPPGNYELGPWKINGAMLLVGAVWSMGKNYSGPKNQFSVEIKPDAVSYAGEISIDEANNNSASITDNFDCEKEYLARTWPWMIALPRTNAESIPTR